VLALQAEEEEPAQPAGRNWFGKKVRCVCACVCVSMLPCTAPRCITPSGAL
jgi:hypothetical protein